MMNNNNKNNQNMNIINLQEVKKNLLSGELVRQIIAVEEIKNTLDLSNDQISRSKLIDDLMKFDITRILYTETLATSSNDLMISILNLAPDLSESKYFFSKEFVQETVDMLLKIGLMINQSKSGKNEKQLRALNRALNTILSGAEASRQQLPKICDIIRLTKYINELNLVDHGFTISATKLTCIVLNYGNTIKDKAEFTEIVKLFEKITNALMEIIDVQKELPNDTIYQRAIELLLIIFYKSAKICHISALSVHVCRDKILHILLNIIEVHPDKLIVDKSFKEIKELLQLESRKEKTREIIWHKLSNVLMSYTKENENNIKTYLKLVNDLPYKKFSKELLFRFVGIFVDNKKTIQQLFHQANLLDNDDKLSNVCFECLKQIFLNQIVFDEECNDPVIFPLMDIFYSLRNNSTANSAMPSYCWTNIFNCLSEILEFLKRKEYINTLKSCLDYSGNYNLKSMTG
ncbi:uncharacterized protein LOC122859737 [Aphidius gifuensis]|uniref:uncharacterized protein LOC122859737 n=1 Tax=Aphidius gifuensis TaxID=684658 RepID=UPI001CDCE029|nr:uncharacterized protein LOC122859737 [Aphidius gifuensis]